MTLPEVDSPTMLSPGAARSTQGPCRDDFCPVSGVPALSVADTATTYWSNQAGEAIVTTSSQPRSPVAGGGFWVHPWVPALPAAVMMTTSRSTAA